MSGGLATGSWPGARPTGSAPEADTVARLAALPGVSTAGAVAGADVHARTTGKVLPVLPALAGLLPRRGLPRGSTIAVHGSTSLLLALLAGATAAGSWAAVVGLPRLGVVAAGELGVEVSRLALIPRPGAEFPAVTAALLDGMDLVVVCPPTGSGAEQVARRLSARARHRGAVLLSAGAWRGAEMEVRCRTMRWSGTAGGHGRLRAREVAVEVSGRAALARPVRSRLLLPGPEGAVAAPPAVPVGTSAVSSVSSRPSELSVNSELSEFSEAGRSRVTVVRAG